MFAPTRPAVIVPKIMLGIAKKIVNAPNDIKPMGSQLKGVRSLKISESHDSDMKTSKDPEPLRKIIPVTAR